MEIDTARIIMFLECNFKCRYCCNEKTQFNQEFVEISLDSIPWEKYKVACVSGGEPFFNKEALYRTLGSIPERIPVYIYTNGILITIDDIMRISGNYNVVGFNIGIHGVNQPKFIIPELDEIFSVRWQAQDINREKLLSMYPDRIREGNSKFWKMDDCYRRNEDWFLLTDFLKEGEKESHNVFI